MIGVWSVDIAATKLPAISIPGAQDRVSSLVANAQLKLLSDHTFVLSSGVVLEGKWTYAPGALTLIPSKGPKTLQATIAPDEQSLALPVPTPLGEAVLKFRKSG